MKCSTVALVLASVQLFAGLGLTALAIHTMLKLPSLSTRDCPLWAAGPVSAARNSTRGCTQVKGYVGIHLCGRLNTKQTARSLDDMGHALLH